MKSRYSARPAFRWLRGRGAVCATVVSSLALPIMAIAATNSPALVDYARDIRPILSDRCYKCHGPDEESRKAKLRLDLPEELSRVLDEKKGLRVFAPRNIEKSEALRRITTDDPDDQMPPPKSKLKVSTGEVALIKRWIEQGAEHKSTRHWAFIPVSNVLVPAPKANGVARNAIDAFVLDRMDREKLRQSPEANRETLIRRLALDLTGLPPKVEEIDAFLADLSPDAYEKQVEYYLGSLAYGERMANDWLDLARYADTYGYQADVDRDMSPWRDWVIGAFNKNLSYDQFILWQIAGDLLPNPTRDQYLATAFNRLHRQTNEGGSIEEEFRNEYVSDRVHTFGTAFLGLTLECARCHDHKFDPISTKNYYQLSAFFNNIDESGLYSHFTRATPSPTLLLYQGDAEAKHDSLIGRIAEKEKEIAKIRAEARPRFEAWQRTAGTNIAVPQPVAWFPFENVVSNRTDNVSDTNSPATLSDKPVLVEGHTGKAMRFSGDNSLICKKVGAFGRSDSFTFSLWMKPGPIQDREVVFHRSRSWTDSGSRGYELLLEHGKPSFALIHFYPGNAIRILATDPLRTNEWSHVAISYDGSSRAAGVRIYVNGLLAKCEVVRDNLFRDILHRKEWGDSEVGGIELTLAGRFRDSGFKDGLIDELQVFDRALAAPEIRTVAGLVQISNTAEDSFEAYLSRVDEAHRDATAELKRLRSEENELITSVREIMVMKELTQRRETPILKRGSYTSPGDLVEPGVPEAVAPMPPEFPRNRLGLAKWLIDRRNPLTARVVVNRIWRMHFGRGLVITQEDFGAQGQPPTHPELLDWLAGRFMDSGWDVKALHKLIVMSATFRQTSAANSDVLAVDPENRMLARGPKYRLQAEQIRDGALAVSGLLSHRMGGQSVKPYQPAGLWEESGTGKTYTQDKGEKLYRRSLYTFWRRTAPPPSMLTFDATSREVCTAKRETTTTPLQALVLLNDPQFLEAARVLGKEMARIGKGNVDDQITLGFRRVLGRQPASREREILKQLYREQFDYFSDHPGTAGQYLSVGEAPRDKAIPPAEVAASAVLASALINHDEFVMKR